MKEIDFISSENVVIMESPEKNIIIWGAVNNRNSFILPDATNKKNHFNSKEIEAVNHYGDLSKNYKAMPREISIRINN